MNRLRDLRIGQACLIAILSMASTCSAWAAPKTITGTISRFECGDNCYLVIKTKSGTEETGLCAAPHCDPWNEATAMPGRFKGRRVTVTIGQGTQLDGNGEAVGEFTAFTAIKFLKK